MTPPRCRPFTISDAMILVAATAIGIALMARFEEHSILHGLGHYTAGDHTALTFQIKLNIYNMVIADILNFEPLLESLTLAVLILRLRRPRPSLRRLARQPGFAASFVVLFFLIFQVIEAGTEVAKRMIEGQFPCNREIFYGEFLQNVIIQTFELDFYLGPAVAVMWALMALGRTFRREAGWIDRLGRIMGSLWIAAMILRFVQTGPG
jgi:hypothetical protein